MAYLFVTENNIAKPNTETLLISPFKEIWERDKSKDKEQAIKEFTFIELMSSKRKSNPYAGYTDEVRFERLRDYLFNSEWKPDKLVEEGLIKIREFQTEASPTYMYYMSNLKAMEKTRKFLETVDLSERNEKTGSPLYKPADITRSIVDAEKVMQTLAILKDKMEQELYDTVKTKNNKLINPFEE